MPTQAGHSESGSSTSAAPRCAVGRSPSSPSASPVVSDVVSEPTATDPDEAVAQVLALAEAASHDAAAVGVVLPGLVDEADGVGVWSENIGWRDVAFGDLLRSRLDRPGCHRARRPGLGSGRTPLGRRPRAVGRGGRGRRHRHLRGPLRGRSSPARTRLSPASSGTCAWPTTSPARAGGPAAWRRSRRPPASCAPTTRSRTAPSPGPIDVADAVRRGEAVAVDVWSTALDRLADGLAALTTVVAPEAIVLGGGLALAGEEILVRPAASPARRPSALPPGARPAPRRLRGHRRTRRSAPCSPSNSWRTLDDRPRRPDRRHPGRAPRRDVPGRRGRRLLGVLGASVGARRRGAPGAGGRHGGADRGHVQPGGPGRRLHRDAPGRLPRPRARDRRRARSAPRPGRPRRGPPRPQRLACPGRGRGDAARRGPRRGVRRGGLHQAPPRLQHVLRRRPRAPLRREVALLAPPGWPRPPRRRRGRALSVSATSSAPRCRCRAGRTRPSTPWRPPRPRQPARRSRRTAPPSPTAGLGDAWQRVVAVVVQPGVEFDHQRVFDFEPDKVRELSAVVAESGLVFEAHSTDYQLQEGLRALVEDHWAVLKVGPGLTFALREALFALAAIEDDLVARPSSAPAWSTVVDEVMLAEPPLVAGLLRGRCGPAADRPALQLQRPDALLLAAPDDPGRPGRAARQPRSRRDSLATVERSPAGTVRARQARAARSLTPGPRRSTGYATCSATMRLPAARGAER